jgi:uncharacterized protein YjbI with pentapeptide repeats
MSNWIEILKTDIEAFNDKIAVLKEEERNMFRAQDLSGLDLRKAKFNRCDLSFANLSNAIVEGYQLSGCRLEGTNLQQITFADEHWKPMIEQIQILWKGAADWNSFRAHTRPVLLNAVNFSDAAFNKFDLSGLSFISSTFNRAKFKETDLTETSFRSASLCNASFIDVNLKRSDFTDATLVASVWENANLDNVDLSGANLSKAVFENVSFMDCNLNDVKAEGAVFNNCKFVKTIFYDAELSNCQFLGCTFVESELNKAHKNDGMVLR